MVYKELKDEVIRFPIRELSARTKVNTVTIRAWERRYGLLDPQRTSKGHRLYSDEDVNTIEKILSLVARGVPIRKVKPLLNEDINTELKEDLDTEPNDDSGNWLDSITRLTQTIKSLSASRVEHLIDEFFLNYPPSICREKLIEPTLEALSQQDDKAAYLFAESVLFRYSLYRLNSHVAQKNRPSLTLISGDNTPLWRLSLMAMELFDANYRVQILCRPFSVDACIDLSRRQTDSTIIFYQDGVWRDKQSSDIFLALKSSDNLLLCGTAAMLAKVDVDEKVFPDLSYCVQFLLGKS